LRRKLFTLARSETVARSTACEASLSRAAIATGLAATSGQTSSRPRLGRKTATLALILCGSVGPIFRDNASALQAISLAR